MLISTAVVQDGKQADTVQTVVTRGIWKEIAENLVENVEVTTYLSLHKAYIFKFDSSKINKVANLDNVQISMS